MVGLNFRMAVEVNEGAMDLLCLLCDSPSAQNSPFPTLRAMAALIPGMPTYDHVSLAKRCAAAFGSQSMILFCPHIIGISYTTPYSLDHASNMAPESGDSNNSLPTPNNRLVLFGPLSLVVLDFFRIARIAIRNAHMAASPVATLIKEAERTSLDIGTILNVTFKVEGCERRSCSSHRNVLSTCRLMTPLWTNVVDGRSIYPIPHAADISLIRHKIHEEEANASNQERYNRVRATEWTKTLKESPYPVVFVVD